MDAPVRVQNWPVLLAQEIEAAREKPFAWGTHDCAAWAFSVAARLRGEPRPAWVGRYRTRIGSLRALTRAGVTLEGMGTAILGPQLDTPLFAQRGDVVFAGGAYGVCIGQDVAHVTECGLIIAPLQLAERAWRV